MNYSVHDIKNHSRSLKVIQGQDEKNSKILLYVYKKVHAFVVQHQATFSRLLVFK